MYRFSVLIAALAFAVPAISADPVASYPNRPVRMITGSAGSTSDIAARFVAQKLSERWGQQVVVDNRPGAGGIIGAEIGAKAAPDGYTLTVGQIGTHASAQFLFKSLAYDPIKDFVPITLMTNSGIALAVHPSVPASNMCSPGRKTRWGCSYAPSASSAPKPRSRWPISPTTCTA